MLSRFRRPAPPAIHEPPEPPPPVAARKAKESRWLASIGRSSSTQAPSQARYAGTGSAGGVGESPTGLRAGTGHADERTPSIRSARSFRVPFGRSRGRRTSAAGDGGAPNGLPPRDERCESLDAARRPSSSAPPAIAAQPLQREDSTPTVSLAQRLQELAVANADGLLDEDEYRILRTQLFQESNGAATAACVEGENDGITRLGEGNLAQEALSPEIASASAPSFVSSKSKRISGLGLTGLFRRPSSVAPSVRSGVEPIAEGWNLVSSPQTLHSPSPETDATSVFSGTSSIGGYSRLRVNFGDSLTPTASSPHLGSATVRTRSIRHHAALSSSAFDARSPRSTSSATTLSSPDLDLLSPSSTYSHASRSSQGSHAVRLRSLTASALPPLPSSSDPSVLASAEREAGASELREEMREIEEERESMRGMWEGMIRGKVRSWEEQVGEEVVKGLSEDRRKLDGGSDEPARRGSRFSTLLSSSILSTPFNAALPDPTASPVSFDALLPPFLRQPPLSPFPSNLPDDLDLLTRALERDVRDLAARARQTDDKYERRMEFLRAKLRGAELRERLGR
ncbi:hypothetical protein Rhopal_007408-T1 [Rhodotorula paludigena]|uniref:Uncharacterized protein n=1 Tax=Rhodotorula paludigena TaxID=86838 RepID=A0AAV5GWK7_9BASI|nr:hypothetical protein Rhopal_007408-T1 [Rhodotorula paludigena]